MKKLIVLMVNVAIILPVIVACSTVQQDDYYKAVQTDRSKIDSLNLPEHAINDVVKGLAYQLLESSSQVNPTTPVGVTSFVNLKNLQTTNWLGNQLTENFIFELQRHGLIIIDYKMTGDIRVTEQGDYVLSREWDKLPQRQLIDYVVTGTMVEQEDGILVNARMIGVQSKVVVATAQSFIPAWVVGDEINPNENVKLRNGFIVRDTAMLEEDDVNQ